jgi:hypothetical protein
MKTKYTDKIIAFIDKEITTKEFESWFVTLPSLDQPEILKEIKTIVELQYGVDPSTDENSIAFAKYLDDYEDKVLSLHLKLKMAQLEVEEVKKKIKEVVENFKQRREYVHFRLANKLDDLDELKETVRLLIDAEKQIDIYDPENWKAILEML